MIKKIVLIISLLFTPIIAKTIALESNDQQVVESFGIKIVEIASLTHGFIENSNEKSTVLLGKVVLSSKANMNFIYDPWEESYAKDDHRKLTKIIIDDKPKYAIVIITNSKINVLVERKGGYELSASYPFKIKLKPKNVIHDKQVKKFTYTSIIEVPDGSGMSTYLFWNGKKYNSYWERGSADDDDQG